MSIKRSMNLLVVFIVLSVSLLPLSAGSAQNVTTVHVNGEATGFLPAPCNCVDNITIAVNAIGDLASLEGSGVIHSSLHPTINFIVTGSTSSEIVHLSGTVYSSNVYFLEGSAVEIEADAATGSLKVTLVLSGGLFAGQPLLFTGSAMTVITGN